MFLQEVTSEFAWHTDVQAMEYAAAFKLYNFRKVEEKEMGKKNESWKRSTFQISTRIGSTGRGGHALEH